MLLVGRTVVLFSGAGKTCLMGNWSLQHQEKFPSDAVVCHFAGCTSASTGKYLIITGYNIFVLMFKSSSV